MCGGRGDHHVHPDKRAAEPRRSERVHRARRGLLVPVCRRVHADAQRARFHAEYAPAGQEEQGRRCRGCGVVISGCGQPGLAEDAELDSGDDA